MIGPSLLLVSSQGPHNCKLVFISFQAWQLERKERPSFSEVHNRLLAIEKDTPPWHFQALFVATKLSHFPITATEANFTNNTNWAPETDSTNADNNPHLLSNLRGVPPTYSKARLPTISLFCSRMVPNLPVLLFVSIIDFALLYLLSFYSCYLCHLVTVVHSAVASTFAGEGRRSNTTSRCTMKCPPCYFDDSGLNRRADINNLRHFFINTKNIYIQLSFYSCRYRLAIVTVVKHKIIL